MPTIYQDTRSISWIADPLFDKLPRVIPDSISWLASPCMQKLAKEAENGDVEALKELLLSATAEVKKQGGSWLFDSSAKKALRKLPPQEIKALFLKMIEEAVDATPLLANADVEKLKQAFNIEDLQNAARCELLGLEFDQRTVEGWFEGELRDITSVFVNFFPNLLNLFLFAFSFFDEGKQPDMIWDVYLILDIYTKFLMLPGALVVALGFFFTSTATIWIVAGATTTVALGALYGYLRYFKPFPQKLSFDTENWSLLASKNQLPPAAARADEIREMLRYQLGDGLKRHVLLVGEPGCGKTTLAKAAAKSLQETNPEKQVYAVKPAVLTEKSFSGGPSTKLERLKMQLGRNAGKSVLFIDEFHSVVSGLGDHLKTVLDDKVMSFWGATTLEGFSAMMNEPAAGQALMERFHVVFIKDPDNEDERVQKLFSMAAAHISYLKSFVQVDPDAVEHAIKCKLDGYGQPRLACDLLEGALARARQNLEGEPESSSELKAKRLERERLLREYGANPQRKLNPGGFVETEVKIQTLANEITSLEALEAEKKENLKKLTLHLISLSELEKEFCALANALAKKGTNAQQKRFIEIRCLLRPALQQKINSATNALGGVGVRVTKDLIDVELEWRKKNQPANVDE